MGSRESAIYLAVLVPHRDSRRLLRQWSGELFAAGYWGAWSFPHAAPLALLSAPLNGDELKGLARALRDRSLAGGRDGMFHPGAAAILPLTAGGGTGAESGAGDTGGESGIGRAALHGLRLCGPALDIGISGGDFGRGAEKIVTLFPRPLLGCMLLPENQDPPAAPPGLRFRAAAAANLRYSPLTAGEPGYSFSWKIGKLHWLPPPRSLPRGQH